MDHLRKLTDEAWTLETKIVNLYVRASMRASDPVYVLRLWNIHSRAMKRYFRRQQKFWKEHEKAFQ
jgi:hypothetical protein